VAFYKVNLNFTFTFYLHESEKFASLNIGNPSAPLNKLGGLKQFSTV
jgi:hypothetical protein